MFQILILGKYKSLYSHIHFNKEYRIFSSFQHVTKIWRKGFVGTGKCYKYTGKQRQGVNVALRIESFLLYWMGALCQMMTCAKLAVIWHLQTMTLTNGLGECPDSRHLKYLDRYLSRLGQLANTFTEHLYSDHRL